MFRVTPFAAVALATLSVAACDQATPMAPSAGAAPPELLSAKAPGAGNGAPSGAHYNLNLIGLEQGKTATYTSGNRIFIPYDGSADILLTKGDYQVIDGNGTDGEAAFQLPDPAPADGSDQLAYSVWIRPVAGKGSISFQSCFTDSTGTWCYAGALVQNLRKNKTFVDVSKDLLQVCADVDPTAGVDLELVPLFSDENAEYFWHLENDGMRNVQMRFYDLATTPVGGDCTQGPHPAH